MKFEIPLPLQQEHEQLHAELRQATRAEGEVGEAARHLAQLMHPHFVKEDEMALPPLGLLRQLAAGRFDPAMGDVLDLTDRLRAELPAMLEEHQSIVAALARLEDAARRAGRDDVVEFAQALKLHAATEEQVMYPAALLVGELVRRQLAPADEPSAA
jgi:Hemerythrin HHE cation binding domain